MLVSSARQQYEQQSLGGAVGMSRGGQRGTDPFVPEGLTAWLSSSSPAGQRWHESLESLTASDICMPLRLSCI